MVDARALILEGQSEQLTEFGDGDLSPGRREDQHLDESEVLLVHQPIEDPDEADPDLPLPWIDRVQLQRELRPRRRVVQTVNREASAHGFDTLAWYLSPRVSTRWGIHIRETAIESLAGRMSSELSEANKVRAALLVLHRHEYFHFLVDLAVSGVERVVGNDLYLPMLRRHARGAVGYDPLEEGLANAYVMTGLDGQASKTAVARFLKRAPIGYKDFDKYRALEDRQSARRRLIKLKASLHGTEEGGAPLDLLIDEHHLVVRPCDVPVWLHRDDKGGGLLRLITAITELHESSKFRRMLRKLPIQVRTQWVTVRERIATDVGNPELKFKKLKESGDSYSVRVTHDYRALLSVREAAWTAEEIGHRRHIYEGR